MWGYNYFVYILTNRHHTVLYTGVTNDLRTRVYEHKEKIVKGFTNKYNVDKLVYFEHFTHIDDAIAREKQIKAGSRKKKIELINSLNPEWIDLYLTELID
jgi:putative endonuclease